MKKRKAIPLAHFSRSLISDYNSQKPLSVIQLDNGKFMAAFKITNILKSCVELTVEIFAELITIAGF